MKPRLLSLFVALLVGLSAPLADLGPAWATPSFHQRVAPALSPRLPPLEKFIAAETDGQTGVVRGVYVPEVLALSVWQQPTHKVNYVFPARGVVTQFGSAAQYGVVGLLAHDTSSGALFFRLQPGQVVWLVYGDGATRKYKVDTLYRYQTLKPDSVYSDLVNLDTQLTENVNEVFGKVYMGVDQVTFQTCIPRDGNTAWGKLFIVAHPAP